MESIFGGSSKADKQAQADRAAEAARQQRIQQGTQQIDSIFGQFNDPFYQQRQKSYLDYANPQLEDQYAKARKDLTFALARSGQLDSSVRAAKDAELTQKYSLNKQGIADQALTYGNQARGSVEDARSNLIATLNSSGDAQGAANQALARAQALSAAPAYSPLGQLFSDFTSALGTQAAAEKATMQSAMSGGNYQSPYNLGLFRNDGAIQVRGR
jgi:hypothetical protein